MYARGVKSISLVGNKSDLDAQRVVSQNAAMVRLGIYLWRLIDFSPQDLAKQHNIEGYYETSAKTGDNVDTVFMELTQHMLKDKLSGESKEGPPSQGSYTTSTTSTSQPPVDLQASSAPKKKKRCMVWMCIQLLRAPPIYSNETYPLSSSPFLQLALINYKSYSKQARKGGPPRLWRLFMLP